jgi:hypothetical protein
MARIAELGKKQAPWHLRWYYVVMRKNVQKRSYTGQDSDAPARSRVRRYSDGSRSEPQFSEEQLMQLGGHIAFENYRARRNRLFNVESDNLYQGTVS